MLYMSHNRWNALRPNKLSKQTAYYTKILYVRRVDRKNSRLRNHDLVGWCVVVFIFCVCLVRLTLNTDDSYARTHTHTTPKHMPYNTHTSTPGDRYSNRKEYLFIHLHNNQDMLFISYAVNADSSMIRSYNGVMIFLSAKNNNETTETRIVYDTLLS